MEGPLLKKTMLLLGASASLAALSVQSANAAFFAVREQSAYNQGSSFAGAAAQTNALSSFFFNPAVVTEFEGVTAEGTLSAIFPFTDADTTANGDLLNPNAPPSLVNPPISGILAGAGFTDTTSNIGREALVPASYFSYQATDKIWVALAVNAPFGLGTRSDPSSLESLSSQEFSALSINFQPTVGYKFNDRFSIAVGLQAQHIDVEQSAASLAGVNTELNATGNSFGAIFGATFKPTDKTTIGVGYRSQMDVDLSGDLQVIATDPALGVPVGTVVAPIAGATADLALPDIVNVGITHKVTDKFTALASFSWENWSRLQSVDVESGGATAATFDFNLSDSYFGAIGGEYEINDHFTVRAGVAYETSPTNDEDRSLALPDNNRIWLSAGATHKLNEKISTDIGFTYIRVEGDTPVGNSFQSAGTLAGDALNLAVPGLAGQSIAAGTADSQVVIFAVGSRIQF